MPKPSQCETGAHKMSETEIKNMDVKSLPASRGEAIAVSENERSCAPGTQRPHLRAVHLA